MTIDIIFLPDMLVSPGRKPQLYNCYSNAYELLYDHSHLQLVP